MCCWLKKTKGKASPRGASGSRKQKRAESNRFSRSFLILNSFLVAIFLVGLVGYLSQISQSTTYGFLVSKLQLERGSYQERIQKTEQQINSLTSVEIIASKAQELRMVPNGHVDFLDQVSTGVAYRE